MMMAAFFQCQWCAPQDVPCGMPRFSPRRNTLRSPRHDYRDMGRYLLTLVVEGRHRLLGRVTGGRFLPTELGNLVRAELDAIPVWCDTARVDTLAVMPDHLHLILELRGRQVGGAPVPRNGPASGSVSMIIGQIKARSTTAAIRGGLWMRGQQLWQRSFHDRILPDERALYFARRYLALNPLKWEEKYGRRG